MTVLEVKNWRGQIIDSVVLDLPEAKESTSKHIVHRALTQERTNSRQGSVSTKTRAEVRGGGKKPWRQKGTGRARAGSNRSPLWRGGGVVFGPKPRTYDIKMNRKEKRLALGTVFQRRAEDMIVVDHFEKELPRPKTKAFVEALNRLGEDVDKKRILLILEEKRNNVYLSARNLQNIKIISANNLNVFDLLARDLIIVTRQALELINSRLNPVKTVIQEGRKDSLKQPLQNGSHMSVSSKIEFPDKVHLGEVCILEVAAEVLSSKVELLSSKIDVWILISPEDFDLRSPESQTLEVTSGKSKAQFSVVFELVPKKVGAKLIKVDFLQGTRYLGRQEISTEIYYSNGSQRNH